MNQVLREGASTVEHAWVLGVTMVIFLLCFIGWTWWAFTAKHKARWTEAALLPLRSDEDI